MGFAMSIAVLNQVYEEARRLAVAGSVVARGDFRLKKLLPPLEQAGAKAPVFAKVAECARAVIDGPEDTSAESLLELTSLVTAVLYTQGETGIAGPLEPIETIDFGRPTAQTSARLLKPLLEALSRTGSGRLELVKDAHERGAFRDLRLIRPALNGLDDPYPEIADFLAEQVLPLYGTAILPELRKTYDPKGAKGHPRRLRLMHAIDPAGSRDLVKQALESGSKEVKVAAIACLGAAHEDLSYLIEQAAAKAQEVRGAAYHALASIDDPAAVAVLEQALAGKDLELAASAIERSKSDRLTALLVTEIQKDWAALPKAKDKKQVGEKARRLVHLIRALPAGEHPAADALTLDLFARRGELAKVKGDNLSGSDVAEAVVARMASGPKPLQSTLARAHAELDSGDLAAAFGAARQSLPPAEVYDLFADYLTAKEDAKKGKGAGATKRQAIIAALDGDQIYSYHRGEDGAPLLDPRWLDLAVRIKHLGLVHAVGRPGHRAADAFVQGEFDAAFKKAKNQDQVREVLTVMVRLGHPKATDALLASYEKTIGKANANTYWYYHLIPGLPKSAIPRLEAVVPKLKDREADQWLEAIQQLRDKA
jgi:hypothetical protein